MGDVKVKIAKDGIMLVAIHRANEPPVALAILVEVIRQKLDAAGVKYTVREASITLGRPS